MGRTAGPPVAVAVAAVSVCAALTCAALTAAAPAPVRAERQDAGTAGSTAGNTVTGGVVRAAAGASLTADDPNGPGLRVGVCLDVDVIVDLHAEVGIGRPGCTPPTPVPPPTPEPPPAPKPPVPAPEKPAPAPRHSPHRVAAAPRPAAAPSPSPRPTPRPTPSPSPVYRVPAMRAIAPVRHRNPLGTLTVVIVLSVAIAAAGAAAFRR
ncbi:hypothetical protein [Microbispora rosea]|uniref:hypothetical protein n=1 Tax=Microbispora rosea TaxID=58117 RepID=UPI0004C33123|nr:hypothetical protein [Microbispora rosea]